MSFTYNNSIPAAGNNPSADQPIMLQNTKSIQNLIDVDHVDFNATSGQGEHKQVTFNAFNPPSAPSDPTAIAYIDAGLDAPTHPQGYFVNSQATMPLTAIKAFGTVVGTTPSGTITATNYFNINPSIVYTNSGSTKTFVITLVSGTVLSTNKAAVFIYIGSTNPGNVTQISSYSFNAATNPTTLTIDIAFSGLPKLNFMILQI